MKLFRLFPRWGVYFILVQVSFLVGKVAQGVPETPDELGFTLASRGEEAEDVLSLEETSGILKAYLQPKVTPEQADEIAQELLNLSNQYRLSPAFLLGLIHVESTFKSRAVSPNGARGLMQVLPATARHVAHQVGIHYTGAQSLFNPVTNLRIGTAYLAQLRDHYRYIHKFIFVAAYLVGPSRADELLRQKDFRPQQTLRYYQRIRDRMLLYRHLGQSSRV